MYLLYIQCTVHCVWKKIHQFLIICSFYSIYILQKGNWCNEIIWKFRQLLSAGRWKYLEIRREFLFQCTCDTYCKYIPDDLPVGVWESGLEPEPATVGEGRSGEAVSLAHVEAHDAQALQKPGHSCNIHSSGLHELGSILAFIFHNVNRIQSLCKRR